MRAIRYHEYQKDNPHRPVDWRWWRAQRLVEEGRYASQKRDDLVTCRAVHFLRALGRAGSRRARSGLARSLPHMFGAHQLRTGPWQRRLEVEARLLARQTPTDIAATVGATPEVITLYHDLFFDVEARIHASDYIMKAAVWKGARAGSRDHVAEALLRFAGYYGGMAVLNVMLLCLNGSTVGDRQPTGSRVSPPRLYGKARRLLELFVEFSSQEHASSGLTREHQVAVADRCVSLVEANQKAEEFVKTGALPPADRSVGAVKVTDLEADLSQQEAIELLSCEAG